MLHINSITIRNFRPYYGVKKFDFGSENGLSVIFGDNGIGKSSLIRALKFVLYDEFDNDSEFKIKNQLNIIAWEEQSYDMYVALDFDYNDDKYILKRSKTMNTMLSEPKNDGDFIGSITLNKNGRIQSNDETERLLKNIIPKKISEYILFEGETISKYKDLLDNNKNQEIYESIRKILGLTILENSQFDLENQLEQYENQRIKLLKDKSTNDNLKKKLSNLEEERRILEESIDDAILKRDEALNQKSKYEEFLRSNQRSNDLIEKKANKEAELKIANDTIQGNKDTIKGLIKNYKYFSLKIIESSLEQTPQDIVRLKKIKDEQLNKTDKIKMLEELLDSDECTYCGSNMDDKHKKIIMEKINKLKKSFNPLKDDEEEILLSHESKVMRFKELLSEIKPNDKKIKDLETEIQTKVIETDRLKTDIKGIKEQINSLGGDDLEKITKAYATNERNIDLHNKIIDDCDTQLKVIQKSIDQIIKKEIVDIDLSKIDSKIKTTKSLIEIFKDAIKKFSYKMRLKVQNDATELFKEISNNQEYERLEFDDYYGLKLIDKRNRIVPNISSGYMTLITISLIYGLHKNSSLTGTIVLDAPFSVLTDFHRDRIISAFQKLSPQVILLVYKDQVDIFKVREQMQGKLINEFEIYQNKNHPDYSYKTEIKRWED